MLSVNKLFIFSIAALVIQVLVLIIIIKYFEGAWYLNGFALLNVVLVIALLYIRYKYNNEYSQDYSNDANNYYNNYYGNY